MFKKDILMKKNYSSQLCGIKIRCQETKELENIKINRKFVTQDLI